MSHIGKVYMQYDERLNMVHGQLEFFRKLEFLFIPSAARHERFTNREQQSI